MSRNVVLIEPPSPTFPAVLRTGALISPVPRLWAMGNLEILCRRLLGLFCATRCPGAVILRTYDLAQALRAARVAVISGFHTPMEKECLDLLLRGEQPVVICPARSIEHMRLPLAWRKPLAEQRLLILSPFAAQQRRSTIELAETRNRFVATLADTIVVTHAPPGSKTARLCAELVEQDKPIATLELADNAHLLAGGLLGYSVNEFVASLSV